MSVTSVAASDVGWDSSQLSQSFATSDIQLARHKTFDRVWARRFNLAVRIIDDSSRWDESQPTSLDDWPPLSFWVALIACNQGGVAARGHSQG